MQSRLLRHFLAIYDQRGIGAAAEFLGISQPALTKSLRQLETDLGVDLFVRVPTGVIATRYGDILARRTRLMDMEYRHALAEIDAAREGHAGTLRLGAGPVWMTRFLPPIVASFLARNPQTRIEMQGGVIDTLIPRLEDGDLDIVCATLEFPNRSEIVKETLIDVRHVVVADGKHPLASRARITARDLLDHRWLVLANDSVGTGRILSFFAAHNCPPPQIAGATSSTTSMFELVTNGAFIAHIPEPMFLHAGRYGLVKLPVDGTFWETTAGIAYRRSETRLAIEARFIETLRRAFA